MWSDKNALDYFLSIQDILDPTMSIEVGSFDADFSKAIVKMDIPSFAFEASPHVFERFKNTVGDVIYINKAITDYEGMVTFNYNNSVNDHSAVGNNGIKYKNIFEIGLVAGEKVSCTSLDIYFKDLQDQRIALWIDCEGANREVLEGSRNILSMTDSIFIEVEHTQLWLDIWTRGDVIKYLESHDFFLHKEYPAYPNQTNCIFIKKSHFGRV